jgi:peptidyl-prolyl cis-trans isomerase D
MAVIQTIRNRFGKIAGAIIALALIGFIIQDARNGTFGDFFRNHDSSVMKVNGNKINPKDYQIQLKEYETLYAIYNKDRNIDDATRAQMNEQVIQMLVYENIVNEQCEKLGIQTTAEEKKEMIYGMNPDPMIRQFQIGGQQVFINQQTGQFDPSYVKGFEKEISENGQKVDPTGKIREEWEMVKDYVQRMANVNKFNSLFGGSIYYPSYLAKRSVSDQNSRATIKYVKVPYTSIADAEVKVTDDELKSYIEKHPGMYTTDQPTRSIEYVSFDIKPSSSDSARVLNSLADMKNEFATTKDNKTYVNSKSDDANSFSEAFVNKKTYMSANADTILELPVGTVYGPYFENGSFRLTKIVDRKTLPDSVKVRHILVRTKAQDKDIMSDSAAKARIDSAVALLKSGAKFDSIVGKYSEDEGSIKKGGEYTFPLAAKPSLAKEFGDFAFEGKKGETKVVKVSNDNYSGYHYIEIMDQMGVGPAVQLATISKTLAPSDSTVNAIYGKANEFAGKNTNAAAFDATADKMHYDKRLGDGIKASNFSIPGLGPSREVVRWAFEHNLGDISPVFQLGDLRYVVAKLVAVQEKGLMAINAANRPMLEQRVREEKKAEIISKKFAGAGSVDAVAQNSGGTVQVADSVTAGGAYVPNLGYEPKVVGYTFNPSFQLNAMSPGIKGQSGVYFITVVNRNVMQVDQNMMPMIQQQRGMQEYQMRNAIGQTLQQSFIKHADVKYNVANF